MFVDACAAIAFRLFIIELLPEFLKSIVLVIADSWLFCLSRAAEIQYVISVLRPDSVFWR
jgi:hypothetical protein